MIKILTWNKLIFLIIIIVLIQFSFTQKGHSVEPEEFLQDPQQELRARNISKNIRCMVCQNQSIDDSSAQLAKDLRSIIRVKVTEGQTDDEIYKFLTNRYGDFILLKPQLNKNTYLLWFLPLIFFVIGVFVLYWNNRKS